MRTSTLWRCVLSVLLLAVVGCGQPGSPQAQAQEALQAARDQIKQAERGFIPDGQVAQFDDDKSRYRQWALDKAIPHLQTVLAGGTDQQKLIASRFQAMIQLSAARHQMRLALANAAALGAQSASMVRSMVTAQRAAGLSHALAEDQSAAVMIRQLDSALIPETRKKQALQDKAATRAQSLAAVSTEVQRFQAQAQAHALTSRQLQDQAFVLKGDEHYDLLDQAAAAARLANQASTEADKKAAIGEKVQVQLTLYQTGVTATGQVIADLHKRINTATQRNQSIQEAREQAQDQSRSALDALFTQFDAIHRAYKTGVEAKLDAAQQSAADAVDTLQKALSYARGQSAVQQALQFDQLGAIIDHIHVLEEHALAAADHAQTLELLSGQTAQLLSSQQAHAIQTAAQDTASRNAKLLAEAHKAMGKAQTLADALANQVRGDQAKADLTRLQTVLGTYGKRLP